MFKCSKRCGDGRRYRKVRCRQLLSLGQTIDKPERECTGLKPSGEERCNGTECDKINLAPRIKIIKGMTSKLCTNSDNKTFYVMLKKHNKSLGLVNSFCTYGTIHLSPEAVPVQEVHTVQFLINRS